MFSDTKQGAFGI